MKSLTAAILAAAALLPAVANAQIKMLPTETVSASATIEAIEKSTRAVTLRGADGTRTTVTAPPEVKRFDELKVGDVITAKYMESISLRKKMPGEKDTVSAGAAVAPTGGARPGATASSQRTITATITAIDPAVPSISLSGPNNWKYTGKVADKAALAQVKVGDRLDITWMEAVLVSADSAKPKPK